MNKLISWGIGLLFGAVIGATLVVLFAPVSGKALIEGVKEGYEETLEEARQASEQRRIQLEAELARRQGKPRAR
jgi:gas vesicle protein